ncbi:hypothetical protein CF327_g5826 [Tilletia walkeri]|nr:hypothetical protein CF327_g5826 [Tilletia walkeri]
MAPLRVRVSQSNRCHEVDGIEEHRINATTQAEEAFVQWTKSYVPLYNLSNPEQARRDVNNTKQAERRQPAGARDTGDEPHQDQPQSLSPGLRIPNIFVLSQSGGNKKWNKGRRLSFDPPPGA